MEAMIFMHVRSPAISMRQVPRPHRAHRTLVSNGMHWVRGVVSLVIGLVLSYLFLRFAWPPLINATVGAVDGSGRMLAPMNDSLIGIRNAIPVPRMPLLNLTTMLWIAGVCFVLLIVTSILPGRNAPLRYWLSANVAMLLISALYAFFAGHVAYDGASYMALVERTSLLVVLCAPCFIAFVAALLPFTAAELAAMLVFMVLSDTIFAIVRIAAFAFAVSRFGAIAEMNLYMFFGPLMDVVYFMTVYSLVIVSLSRRLNRDEGAWEWL
jgi:hypothetical protein